MKDISLTTVVSLTAAQAMVEPAVMSRITYDGLLMAEGDETL